MEDALTFLLEDALWPREGMERQAVLDRLSIGKLSWGIFMQKYSGELQRFSHIATTQYGHSLMHLAVLANRADCIRLLIEDEPHLKYRKNGQGLTPIDLARMLPRDSLLNLLGFSSKKFFSQDPHILIEDPSVLKMLESLTYLEQPLFSSEKVLSEVMDRSRKAKEGDLIPTERIWMGVYFDHELLMGLHPKVTIRFINDELGFGVFTKQKILPCSFVGEYTGHLQTMKKEEVQAKRYCVRYAIWGGERGGFFIDAENMGNFTRFINHSLKPNVVLQSVYWRGIPRMVCVALEEIQEGTQLSLDYGAAFWKNHHQTPKPLR